MLARNTLLNLGGQAPALLVGLLVMPFVVHRLGPDRFGILALAWVILGQFGALDLGLGRAATKFAAEAWGRGEQERVATIAWTAVLAQAALGIVGGAALVAITPMLVGRVINIPVALIGEARLSFYLLALALPMILISGSFRGVLEASQRFDLVNAVRAPSSTATFLLPALGALAGWGLPGIIALLVAFRGLAVGIQYRLCAGLLRGAGGVSHARPRLDVGQLRGLLTFGGWLSVSSVVDPILGYLDRFVIGAVMTVAAVAYYSAPFEMVTRIWIIPMSLTATLYPAFSAIGGQDKPGLRDLLAARAVKYVLLIVGPIAVLVLVYARELLHMWLGLGFAEQSTTALRVLALGVLVNSLAHIPYSLVQAVGRPDLTAKFHLAELPLHILVVWTLVGLWGITGAAIAWSVRVFVDAVLLFAGACRVTSLTPRAFLDDRVPQIALAIFLLGLGTAGLRVLTADPHAHAFALAAVVPVVGLSAWRFLLDERDRAHVFELLRAVGVK